MGGIAAIAKSVGHTVTGSDHNVYPPMSTQLEQLGITLFQGYDDNQFTPTPDMVIIGNALGRANPAVEYVLNKGLAYTSGPQWLLENLLKDRWVLAVSGTHGKTSTSSMLAWIMESAGLAPGFLIGGVPENFGISARVGQSPFFVIEADEYDSAFFDKRSKFIHYRPRTLVINNLEFDHADIFEDLNAIKKQFHHLVRTVPGNGRIISPADEPNVQSMLEMGCWSEQSLVGNASESRYKATKISPNCSEFLLTHTSDIQGKVSAIVNWPLIGEHNMNNAVTAIAAAHHAGVDIKDAVAAMATFKNVKRRMEVKGVVNGITVYDDFAHHPTAIKTTLQGLRASVGKQKIVAILELRSNTMRTGVHKNALSTAWEEADSVHLLEPAHLTWSLNDVINNSKTVVIPHKTVQSIVDAVVKSAQAGTHILVMSNGGFDAIHQKLLNTLGEIDG